MPIKNSILQQNDMATLVQKIYDSQTTIGIHFYVKGFLSSSWEIAQNLFLQKEDFNDSITDWSTKVIRAIWKFSYSLWKARCDYVHGRETGKMKSVRRKELIILIKAELERTKSHAEHSTKQLR